MIRKRGQYFSYEFMLKRVRYYGTLDGSDGAAVPKSKQQAREIESAIRAKVRAGTYKRSSDRETFASFFDHTFMDYSRKNKRSWRHDAFRGEVLKEFFGSRLLTEITPMLVVSFINARLTSTTKRHTRRGATTVHKEVALLSSVYRMAIGEGVEVVNPCASLPKSVRQRLPARNKRSRFLSTEEEDRLFAKLTGRRSHLWPVVTLALETGLRYGELRRLEVGHVNVTEAVRVVEVAGKRIDVLPNWLLVTRGKNGKPRAVPLSERARAVVLAQMNDVTTGRYLFTSRRTRGMIAEIKTGFCAAVREADIQDFCFHDLRHTFATRLAAAGVDVFAIRDLLGHATTVMSSDYTHTSPERRREAIQMMAQQHSTQLPNYGKITAVRC